MVVTQIRLDALQILDIVDNKSKDIEIGPLIHGMVKAYQQVNEEPPEIIVIPQYFKTALRAYLGVKIEKQWTSYITVGRSEKS